MGGDWAARFWQKVDRRPGEDACWVWTASARNRQGYGSFSIAGRTQLAHRVSYELAYGAIPDGVVLDHLCRNTSCVRPGHLEAVPNRINVLRGDLPRLNRERIHVPPTACPAGHAYTPENTGWQPQSNGRRTRFCKECRRQHARRYRAQRKATA